MSNIIQIKTLCTENGTGLRTSVFFAGCSLHCEGCFNTRAWNYDEGVPFNDVCEQIIDSLRNDYVDGLSILGGEPLDERNQCDVCTLIQRVRETFNDKKSIWLYTGYVINNNVPQTTYTKRILSACDVIIDGPFIASRVDLSNTFYGSSNQRILTREQIKRMIR